MKAIFLKPYIRIKPRDFTGHGERALVTFWSIGHTYRIKRLSPDEALKRGCDIERTDVQLHHRLFINLWFVELQFTWFGKFKKHE